MPSPNTAPSVVSQFHSPGGAPPAQLPAKTLVLTSIAMVAFAANSVLCRMGLGGGAIDASSYTLLRLCSGALTLSLISYLSGKNRGVRGGQWESAALLFLYAIAFSFAYLRLSVASGALLLFGAVQATMIGMGILRGERPRPLEWLGFLFAFGGLVYLLLPGLTSPSPLGSALMLTAGVSWGFYSLRGKRGGDPLAETTGNFLRAVPISLIAACFALGSMSANARGALLAVISGGLASGCGYAVWYAALRGLTATRAAMVQLSVPVFAACGGAIFLGEGVSMRLVASSVLILGGIALSYAIRGLRGP